MTGMGVPSRALTLTAAVQRESLYGGEEQERACRDERPESGTASWDPALPQRFFLSYTDWVKSSPLPSLYGRLIPTGSHCEQVRLVPIINEAEIFKLFFVYILVKLFLAFFNTRKAEEAVIRAWHLFL